MAKGNSDPRRIAKCSECGAWQTVFYSTSDYNLIEFRAAAHLRGNRVDGGGCAASCAPIRWPWKVYPSGEGEG